MAPFGGCVPFYHHDKEVPDGYAAFPRTGRRAPYTAEFLADRKLVRRSMLANPFEKFERKRFMYRSRDLGQLSLNHARLARLADADYAAIREQMHTDLEDYYARV